MLREFTPFFIFVAMGIFLSFFTFALSYCLRSKKPNESKTATYECGMLPEGNAWIQFNMRYYVFALLFIVFDVEAVFLYPWAVVYKKLGLFAFIEMLVFLLILIVGFIYAWGKKALKWQ